MPARRPGGRHQERGEPLYSFMISAPSSVMPTMASHVLAWGFLSIAANTCSSRGGRRHVQARRQHAVACLFERVCFERRWVTARQKRLCEYRVPPCGNELSRSSMRLWARMAGQMTFEGIEFVMP